MKYLEAQAASPHGMAQVGVMNDLVWPKDSPHPFVWTNTKYMPWDKGRHGEHLKVSDEWIPVMELEDNIKNLLETIK
jgi:hypothetical protein